MKAIFAAILLFLSFLGRAATVDTVSIYSKAMNKQIKAVVIVPTVAEEKPTPFPVVYLLHGHGGWYSNWIIRAPELMKYADEFRIMIVCPDGHQSSWYLDSPLDPLMKYETFVGTEVPEYIDDHYSTIKNRKGRAITGLSMGGHGALFLAFRHAETFGACGSMSGGMDLNTTKNKFDIEKRIGDTINYADNWKKYSMINIIEKNPSDSLKIIFDCGVDDFFYGTNKTLHEKMLKLKIPHDYIERPGKHSWGYWREAVKFQLFYFKEFFYD